MSLMYPALFRGETFCSSVLDWQHTRNCLCKRPVDLLNAVLDHIGTISTFHEVF